MLIASSSGVDSFVQLITVLIIFAFVLAITLFVTKWIAGFQKQQMIGKNMRVIESMRLTPNQFVQIVEIGSRYFAIAVSKEHVAVIAELNSDEIDTELETGETDFASIFNNVKDKMKKNEKENKND